MKKDLVLTMNEYLNLCFGIRKHANPPASTAYHVPITAEHIHDLHPKKRGCRCDRWGHPCPGCTDTGK